MGARGMGEDTASTGALGRAPGEQAGGWTGEVGAAYAANPESGAPGALGRPLWAADSVPRSPRKQASPLEVAHPREDETPPEPSLCAGVQLWSWAACCWGTRAGAVGGDRRARGESPGPTW